MKKSWKLCEEASIASDLKLHLSHRVTGVETIFNLRETNEKNCERQVAATKSLVSFPELQRNNFEEGNTGREHFVWNADLRAPVKIDNVETDSKSDGE